MLTPKFIALSTGRSGSRYLADLLNRVGIKTLHEKTKALPVWKGGEALGEVTAQFVPRMEVYPLAQVWHFSRHPQPFAMSLLQFGFWYMANSTIHPHLRRTGNLIADSFLYWVDWNQRIMDGATTPRRTTFHIEDVNTDLLFRLGKTIGIEADVSKVNPEWNERQAFAPIPSEVEGEVFPMMEVLGYAPCR